MADTTLVRKLGLKPGHKVLVLNAPEGYIDLLGPLPEGAQISTQPDDGQGAYDMVQAFARQKADLDSIALTTLQALRPGGILWFAYPKKSSKVQTDLSRDENWNTLSEAGLRPVAAISVDDTWTGLRFRPVEDVRSRK